jgi:hypothetical protein
MQPQVDLMGKGGGRGQLANFITQHGGLNAGKLRPFVANDGRAMVTVYSGKGDPKDPKNYRSVPIANATLRRDEWKALDEAIIGVRDERLTAISDLTGRGLTYDLGNGMGTTVLEWHSVSDAMEAVMTMDGLARGQNDRPNFEHNYLPLPIIHVDYEINARALAASRSLGNPLDTTDAERATRKVNEYLESLLVTDTEYSFGGGTIYSYVNHPDRNTVTLSQNWDASGKTGQEIRDDVLSMKQQMIDSKWYGEYVLYIPTAYETVLDNDFDTTTPGTTIRERLMKISGISGIQVVDKLASNNVLLVQMTSDVVRLVRGTGLQNVEWQQEGNFVTKYKVFTIQVPQIRSPQSGATGIVHLS